MRKVVRELIQQRQQRSEDLLEQVDVKQVGGGRAKDCFKNSVDFAVQNSDRERYKIVSGWLVGEFQREDNGTAIIHHYWNYDTKTKEYIDITPNVDGTQTYKYVIDTDLMFYSQQPHIYEVIDDCVGHSIWYSNGKWSLVDKDLNKGEISSLSADVFFKPFECDFIKSLPILTKEKLQMSLSKLEVA